MDKKEENIGSVEWDPRYHYGSTGDDIVWIPDEVELYYRTDSNGSEEFHSYTSLESVFRLLERLESRESRAITWGSSSVTIEYFDDRVAVSSKRHRLVGSVPAMIQAVEELIRVLFEELDERGVDTRSVARDLNRSRFEESAFDPVAVHDRLMD